MGMGDGATLGRQLQKAAMPGRDGFGRRTVGRHRYRTACSACGRRLLAVPQAAHDACRVYDNHRSLVFTWAEQHCGRIDGGCIISWGVCWSVFSMSVRHRYNRHGSLAICHKHDKDDDSGEPPGSGPVGWLWCCPLLCITSCAGVVCHPVVAPRTHRGHSGDPSVLCEIS